MLRQSLVSFVLKIGLSCSLLFVTVCSFFRPIEAATYYPRFLVTGIDDRGIIYTVGIISLLLVVWILSGRHKFSSSLVVTIGIAIVGLVNITNIYFLLNIAPVFAIGLALVLRYYPRVRVLTPMHVENSPKGGDTK